MVGCALVDNHIPRDDIFDYHPIRECNIYIGASVFDIFTCRSFYIYKKNHNTTYRVYVGLGSDPRTNHVLYADFGRLLARRNIYYILISTATDCLGEWQFATGTLF